MSNSNDAEVIVDIEAELAYWQVTYTSSAFYRPDFKFSQYVASLKFAYDNYLRLHERALEAVLPELRSKYQQTVPAGQQLDWERAAELIDVVWVRLRLSGARNHARSSAEAARQPLIHRRRAYG